MKEELLKGLTEEQIAKVKACKTTEEMLATAKQEGIELTDEQLEAISGGACTDTLTPVKYDRQRRCPKCNNIAYCSALTYKNGQYRVRCNVCGHIFETY